MNRTVRCMHEVWRCSCFPDGKDVMDVSLPLGTYWMLDVIYTSREGSLEDGQKQVRAWPSE